LSERPHSQRRWTDGGAADARPERRDPCQPCCSSRAATWCHHAQMHRADAAASGALTSYRNRRIHEQSHQPRPHRR
jgi:hypothetical protein